MSQDGYHICKNCRNWRCSSKSSDIHKEGCYVEVMTYTPSKQKGYLQFQSTALSPACPFWNDRASAHMLPVPEPEDSDDINVRRREITDVKIPDGTPVSTIVIAGKTMTCYRLPGAYYVNCFFCGLEVGPVAYGSEIEGKCLEQNVKRFKIPESTVSEAYSGSRYVCKDCRDATRNGRHIRGRYRK